MLGWAQPSSQVLFLNVHFVVKATVNECFHPGILIQTYADLGELGVHINSILLGLTQALLQLLSMLHSLLPPLDGEETTGHSCVKLASVAS